jgi:hypothetical protein
LRRGGLSAKKEVKREEVKKEFKKGKETRQCL